MHGTALFVVLLMQAMFMYKAEPIAVAARAAVHSYSSSKPPDTARATALMHSMHKVSGTVYTPTRQ
jgi:hypothetical protein